MHLLLLILLQHVRLSLPTTAPSGPALLKVVAKSDACLPVLILSCLACPVWQPRLLQQQAPDDAWGRSSC